MNTSWSLFHNSHQHSTIPTLATSSQDSSSNSILDLQSPKRDQILQTAPWDQLQYTFLQHYHYQQKSTQVNSTQPTQSTKTTHK